jgi:hypothetical protein
VVDAQAVELAGGEPGQHESVAVGEDARVLDADRGEVGHVEEPSVVERAVAEPPVGERVVLTAEHVVDVVTELAGAVGDREPLVVVGDQQLAVLLDETQLPGLVRLAAQHRQQEPPAVRRLGRVRRVPVDVEPAGVRRGGAVRQHVPPPRVVPRRRDAHVVGDDVEYLAEPVLAQGGHEGAPPLLAAEIVARAAVVDDVVAVGRAGCRLQVRRRVEVADPEVGEVVGEVGGGGEVEGGLELDAVGRQRRRH